MTLVKEHCSTMTKREPEKKLGPSLVKYAVEVDGRACRASIQKVSDSGVFIKTKETYSVGQRVNLTFSLNNLQKTVKAKGKIVRTRPEGFEIECLWDKDEIIYYRKKLVDRRIRKRIRTREDLFALVNKPYPMLGDITDISEDGLSFRYSSQKKTPSISFYLNILRVADGLQIKSIPVKSKWDIVVSRTSRKKGVQFRQLNKTQRSQLQNILS